MWIQNNNYGQKKHDGREPDHLPTGHKTKQNKNINTKFLNSLLLLLILLLLLAIYLLIIQSIIYYSYLMINSKTWTKYIGRHWDHFSDGAVKCCLVYSEQLAIGVWEKNKWTCSDTNKKGYYSFLECSGVNKTGTEKMRVNNLVHWIK